MFCEVCGREIVGKPARALVEGATMIVCRHCAGLGTQLPGLPNRPLQRPLTSSRAPIERLPKAIEESDLVEDYPRVIKEAREKIGLSQQDLAFKAKEKLTVIQKIEMGKMLPTMRLTKELEHILRVKLLVPRQEIEVPAAPLRQATTSGVTLGDVALVRQKTESGR